MTEVQVEMVEISHMTVRISREDEQRRDRLIEQGCCLGCEKKIPSDERPTLGLCPTCYHGAYYAIRKKRKTRAALIKEGRMMPNPQRGRRFANEFTRSINS